MDFISFFSKIGIPSSVTQNIILFLVVVVLVLVLILVIGKKRLIPLLISGYISLALLHAMPGKYLLDYTYELGFFLCSLVLISLYSKQVVDAYVSASGFLWRIFVMSFLETMFFLSIILSILPEDLISDYVSRDAYNLFVLANFHFIWLLLPVIFIFFIRKKINH